jgi:hypothetical protein
MPHHLTCPRNSNMLRHASTTCIISRTFQSASSVAHQIPKALCESLVFKEHQWNSKLITERNTETSRLRSVFTRNDESIHRQIQGSFTIYNEGSSSCHTEMLKSPPGSEEFVYIHLKLYVVIYDTYVTQTSCKLTLFTILKHP